MLGEDHGVDELADRDALAKALASPVLVPRADGVVGGADPVAEVAVEGADARLDLLARHLAEGRRSRVGEEILQGFARQAVRVVLDQLDQSVGEHRSEEHTSELQSHSDLVCRLLLEKKNTNNTVMISNTEQ